MPSFSLKEQNMAKDRVITAGTFDDSVRRIVDRNFSDVSLATAQTDVTSSTVLVNATGLTTDTISLTPGTYKFVINLSTVTGASGGIKIGLKQNNGLTLTSIESVAKGFTASAVAVQHSTTATDAASLFASTTLVIKAEICGTMVIATAGSIQLQFAQNVSDSTTTSVYLGSRMEFTRIGV